MVLAQATCFRAEKERRYDSGLAAHRDCQSLKRRIALLRLEFAAFAFAAVGPHTIASNAQAAG